MIFRILKNRWARLGIFSVVGAAGGFAYYYYIGCVSGVCPITSNPYISTAYGTVIGLLMGADSRRRKNKPKE